MRNYRFEITYMISIEGKESTYTVTERGTTQWDAMSKIKIDMDLLSLYRIANYTAGYENSWIKIINTKKLDQ